MTERAQMIMRAYKAEDTYNFPNDGVAAAIRVIADELSYTIFMPNNDVTVVETKALYELADELEAL
jgi:hypothetical protein